MNVQRRGIQEEGIGAWMKREGEKERGYIE
jgi:hypothetical protein